MTNTEKSSPIEVWLRQKQNSMTIDCTVVYEDESTDLCDVDSTSMRGAMREMTGYFIRQGYQPAGRWEPTTRLQMGDEVETLEAVRQFKPAP